MGAFAADVDQGDFGVSIGRETARVSQGNYGIAIGFQSAYFTQNAGAIAIGNAAAGHTSVAQGADAVAFGKLSSLVMVHFLCEC